MATGSILNMLNKPN